MTDETSQHVSTKETFYKLILFVFCFTATESYLIKF